MREEEEEGKEEELTQLALASALCSLTRGQSFPFASFLLVFSKEQLLLKAVSFGVTLSTLILAL